jgi:hypothetical protein
VVDAIDLVVLGGYSSGGIDIEIYERAQDAVEDAARQGAHFIDSDTSASARVADLDDLLCHPGGVIADPFQLVRNMGKRKDEPQIAGNRRLGSDRGDDPGGQLRLAFVDGQVAGHDYGGGLNVPADQGVDGRVYGGGDEFTHANYAFAQTDHLAVEDVPMTMRNKAIAVLHSQTIQRAGRASESDAVRFPTAPEKAPGGEA